MSDGTEESVEIDTDNDSVTATFAGDDPAAMLNRLLADNGMVKKEDIEAIEISLDMADGTAPSVMDLVDGMAEGTTPPTTTPASNDIVADGGTDGLVEGGSDVMDGQDDPDGWAFVTEADREDGDMPEGTHRHTAAYILAEADKPLKSEKVCEHMDARMGSVSSALSTLYKRRFVKRREVDEGAGITFEYAISERGEEALAELPEPDCKGL